MMQLILWIRPYAKYVLAVWIITIISVSSIPSLPTLKIHTAKADIRLDYLIHFCEYGFLSFMAFLSFTERSFTINYKKMLVITVCLTVFALIDEFHQKFIPGRSFNPRDILSNITGIIAVLIFSLLIFRKIRERIKD